MTEYAERNKFPDLALGFAKPIQSPMMKIRVGLLPPLLLLLVLASCAYPEKTWESCTALVGNTESHLSNIASSVRKANTSSEYAAVMRANSAWEYEVHNRLSACRRIALAEQRTKKEVASLDAAVRAVAWLLITDPGPGWEVSRNSLLASISTLEIELRADNSLRRTAAE